jgi:ribonuclease HIII
MNFEITAKNDIDAFLRLLQREGIKVSPPVKATYCFESDLQKGTEKVKLRVYFGSKGVKVVIQGNKESELYRIAETVVYGDILFNFKDTEEFKEPERYIGTDESGKGDYFGPLVIGGVLMSEGVKDLLTAAGVRDSKLMSGSAIHSTAAKIKSIVEQRFSVVFISPKKYNELYEKFGNLNKLLAWGHARVIENLLEKYDSVIALSDKFGDEKLIKDSLFEKGKTIQLYQYHRAEKYTAVAAASILARDEMNKWFILQEKKYGMVFPKGASGLVDKAAGEFLKKYGFDALQEKAKMHFKTTKKILD